MKRGYIPKNWNLINSRQLQAARALAGMTQKQLAERTGFHVNTVKYLERKGGGLPTSTSSVITTIEQTLRTAGVECFQYPTIGVRLIVPKA